MTRSAGAAGGGDEAADLARAVRGAVLAEVPAARGDLDGAGERGLHFVLLLDEMPERLLEAADEGEGGVHDRVPRVGEAGGIVGANFLAALGRAAAAGEAGLDVERAVVVGELVAGVEVADG